MTDFTDIAVSAWGDTPPDWIIALADACNASSQNQVAKKIGRSAALISTVLRCKYEGDMAAVEDRIRGALMRQTTDCPALGEIELHVCHDWRVRSRRFAGNNALNVTMYRACARCPRNRKAEA
jgi:hypothetical protein